MIPQPPPPPPELKDFQKHDSGAKVVALGLLALAALGACELLGMLAQVLHIRIVIGP